VASWLLSACTTTWSKDTCPTDLYYQQCLPLQRLKILQSIPNTPCRYQRPCYKQCSSKEDLRHIFHDSQPQHYHGHFWKHLLPVVLTTVGLRVLGPISYSHGATIARCIHQRWSPPKQRIHCTPHSWYHHSHFRVAIECMPHPHLYQKPMGH
jgi:hypothetical protein